ncbi:MAG: hypothetical protein KDA94_10935 [Acidimicrobiales bacterium]|nr:hypothetical protein [Acidimicrobiales bacterium]
MTDEAVRATREVDAPAASIFAVLADPAAHAAIDGTGWVQRSTGDGPITAAGEVFRMAMFHPNHPDGTYRTANLVERFDPPRSIGWKTGYEDEDGTLRFGGWT